MKVTAALAALLAGSVVAYVDPGLHTTVYKADMQDSSPLSKRDVQFSWGSEKVRGVNIGGWLVLEP